ncbi:alpha-amylase-like [Macrosteles quadrilineatus]|uniref:alpha-amylase-like n=1 Tax=Macrosteles quadrilineatus TaxID=74068 RepID=UPI0023E243E4|nr:alpha-amylase-like [Macrosteles quadrilineatus]
MVFTPPLIALSQLTLFLLLAGIIKGDHTDVDDEKPAGGKTFELKSGVIAHLSMWRWSDIADECEQFLSKKGFDGVEISPPAETVEPGDTLWERYRVVSYQLINRLGSENQLRDMVKRCNHVGVRVFASVVLNHMAEVKKDKVGVEDFSFDTEVVNPMAGVAEKRIGVGGSSYYPGDMYYPSVPYTKEDFHPQCDVDDTLDAKQIRECHDDDLHDLDQSRESVREKIVHHLNHLINIGVAGFRIEHAKQMHPKDLSVIYQRLKYLSTAHGFPRETRPLIYQDVFIIDDEGPIKYEEYTPLGLVLDFTFGSQLGAFFLSKNDLKDLQNFGSEAKEERLVFVEDYFTERLYGDTFLNYQDPKPYKMAVMFMLARGDYNCKIFSSFQFSAHHQIPPAFSPHPIKENVCSNGWECQHRWRQIYNAVEFHNVVKGTPVTNWWSNDKNQIAFCRGKKGFVAFNLDSAELNENLQTCLPEGEYCDIISGEVTTTGCSGKTIKVEKDGKANIVIPENASPDDGVVAIHIQSGTVYGDGNSGKSET